MTPVALRKLAESCGATTVRFESTSPGRVRVIVGSMDLVQRYQLAQRLRFEGPAFVDFVVEAGKRWEDLRPEHHAAVIAHARDPHRSLGDALDELETVRDLVPPDARRRLSALVKEVLAEAYAPYEPATRLAQDEERKRAADIGGSIGAFVEGLLAWSIAVGFGRAVKAVAKERGVPAVARRYQGPRADTDERWAVGWLENGLWQQCGTGGADSSYVHQSRAVAEERARDFTAQGSVVYSVRDVAPAKTFHEGHDELRGERGLLDTRVEREIDADYRERLRVGADGLGYWLSQIAVAAPDRLDQIGGQLGLPRRGGR